MLGCLEALDYASFVENLTRRDELRFGATCHHLRHKGLTIFVSQGTIDFSRRLKDDERRRLSDAFFQRILLHATSSPGGGGGVVTDINLLNCLSLSNASIKLIAATCPSLTSLVCGKSDIIADLSKYRITDDAIALIAAKCPALTKLEVGGCESLTDESIKAIAANCPELTLLNVWGCERVTTESIKAIAAKCPTLTELNVGGCEGVTNSAEIKLDFLYSAT